MARTKMWAAHSNDVAPEEQPVKPCTCVVVDDKDACRDPPPSLGHHISSASLTRPAALREYDVPNITKFCERFHTKEMSLLRENSEVARVQSKSCTQVTGSPSYVTELLF